MTARWAALGIAALALGTALAVADDGAGAPGPTGRIYFVSWRDATESEARAYRGMEIYSMRPDGSDVRRLTRNRVDDLWPRVSRDGKRLVFVRPGPSTPSAGDLDDERGWLRRPADRSSRARGDPDVGPGRQAHRVRLRRVQSSALWIMNANGTGARVELPEPPQPGTMAYTVVPAWSPTGRSFSTMSSGRRVGRESRRRCTRGYCIPRGRRRPLSRTSSRGRCEVSRSAGARSSSDERAGAAAVWSPDGRSIVFNRGYLPHLYQELAVVAAPGAVAQRRLTTNDVDDHSAPWGSVSHGPLTTGSGGPEDPHRQIQGGSWCLE